MKRRRLDEDADVNRSQSTGASQPASQSSSLEAWCSFGLSSDVKEEEADENSEQGEDADVKEEETDKQSALIKREEEEEEEEQNRNIRER